MVGGWWLVVHCYYDGLQTMMDDVSNNLPVVILKHAQKGLLRFIILKIQMISYSRHRHYYKTNETVCTSHHLVTLYNLQRSQSTLGADAAVDSTRRL